MKVVVPMAGRGSRFANCGLEMPKPLIPVGGRPMIAWALKSLVGVSYSEIVFVALAEHERQHRVSKLVRELVGSKAKVVLLDRVSEGQLCTVLAAQAFIDTDEDLLISSADTYVVSNFQEHISRQSHCARGLISVANMPGDRWSFVRVDNNGQVTQVAEKIRISDYASTGLYYFASGTEFITVAKEMIRNAEKTGGEFYVIPVYQKYIECGWQVGISVASEIWDMGTPEALEEFEKHYNRLPIHPNPPHVA